MAYKLKEEFIGKSFRNRPLESFKKHHIEALLEDVRNFYFENTKTKKKKDVDSKTAI